MLNTLKAIWNNGYVRRAGKAAASLAVICIMGWGFLLEEFWPVRYSLTLGCLMELGAKLLYYGFLTLALVFAVCRFERLFACFKRARKRQGFWYALYFSVSAALLFNPLEYFRVRVLEFDRVIGLGLMSNVDVTRRIGSFQRWFLFFGAAFLLFYMLAVYGKERLKEGGRESARAAAFLDQLMVLANLDLLFRVISYFKDQTSSGTVFHYGGGVFAAVICMTAAYIVLRLEQKIALRQFGMLCMSAFALGLPLAILSRQDWRDGGLLLGVQAVLLIFVLLAVLLFPALFQNRRVQACLPVTAAGLSLLPFVTSFYTELIYILNQHEVFVTLLGRYYAAAALLLCAAVAVAGLFAAAGKLRIGNWKSCAYPCLVFGMGCLYAQIPLEQTYHADIFESANYSILISDFLNFGSIPLVEHYGGHMLTGVLEGVLYGVLNRDYAGAIFSPYSGYIAPVLAVLFFYLVKEVWNEDMALFAALFFPFYGCFEYYGLGVLAVLAAVAYVKKNTWPRAVLLWGAFVWCALYRLDLGYSFGLACMAAMLVFVVASKNKKAVKQLAVSLIGWGAAGAGLWCVLCLAKGIDPILRLREFLAISASNQNWAYAGIGYPEDTLFSWGYIILPFSVLLCLFYTVFSGKIREKAGQGVWVLLMVLGFAYFTNFSRGLVRHSLAETDTAVVTWTAYLFLALFAACFLEKKQLFLPAFAALILCGNNLVTEVSMEAVTIGEYAVEKMGDYVEDWRFGGFSDTESQTYWTDIRDNRGRVVRTQWEEGLEETVAPYTLVLDALLEAEETYVDFINKTFVYSAVNRYNPAYVSQSPMQLSGEFAQEQFIREIEGVPLVMMPVNDEINDRSLDHVENAYRYYKAAEYIYENYVPLCRYEDAFAVWCLKERYEEMYGKAAGLEEEKLSMISYGYDGPDGLTDENGNEAAAFDNGFHSYSLAWLPYIWAQGDDAVLNPAVCELSAEGEYYLFDGSDTVSGEKGNYLLLSAVLDGGGQDTAEVYVSLGSYADGEFSEKYRYFMTAKAGSYDYLLRVSSDYYWYTGEINAVRIRSDAALAGVKVKILEGD